jgi:hypothetical protein
LPSDRSRFKKGLESKVVAEIMTKARPDDLAFLSFFESEPTLLDPNVPWIYNTSSYETERDGYLVRLQISPSYSTLKVILAFAGRELAEAEVTAFTDIEIALDSGRETLIARFGECAASSLCLTLKPQVRLAMVASSDG